MLINEILPIIKNVIQESNRNFSLAYIDKNAYPHSSIMGFAHLNKNLSILMAAKTDSKKVEAIGLNPNAEVIFQSRNRNYILKLYGQIKLSNSQKTIEKILQAYPFLTDYFDQSGSNMILIQLNTMAIEMEFKEAGNKWHEKQSFLVNNGELTEVDAIEIEKSEISSEEGIIFGTNPDRPVIDMDPIKKMITRNHGEMLNAITDKNFDVLMKYICDDFISHDGLNHTEYKNTNSDMFGNIPMMNAETNWGLRDFEMNHDGTVTCQYFHQITPSNLDTIAVKEKEIWKRTDDEWLLFKTKKI
ncbi:MAG: pyridoxamine 5'-phosphate oxidase family protein [Spirochaetes bacterium]|nr:pyridoxamine 5'-phosphate oxidase family protein [Spirochaetota bacterium]